MSNEFFSVHSELIRLMRLFRGSFINSHMELILNPKENTFFRLEDVTCELDLKIKMVRWVPRSIYKEIKSKRLRKIALDAYNAFLGTKFTRGEMAYIYTYTNSSDIAEAFIKSGYDFTTFGKIADMSFLKKIYDE